MKAFINYLMCQIRVTKDKLDLCEKNKSYLQGRLDAFTEALKYGETLKVYIDKLKEEK